MITELIYEAGLVMTGCIREYKTHNIDNKFSKSKQLIFANVQYLPCWHRLSYFFVMADIDTYESYIIQEVGVFWGTTISKIINSFILLFLLEKSK